MPMQAKALDRKQEIQINKHLIEEQQHPEQNNFFEKVKMRFIGIITRLMPYKKVIISVYLISMIALAGICFVVIGKDMMPKINNGQFQIRIKEPDGTRLERTEEAVKQILKIIDKTVDHHVSITSAYVGLVPSSYGTSNLYVFNAGTNEAVLQVELDQSYKVNTDELKDALRKNIANALPDLRITFEPIDMTEKIMRQRRFNPH